MTDQAIAARVHSRQPAAPQFRPIAPAPCTAACPAGVNVKAYVSLIAEERFAEALEVVRERCPLPSVCGRVCHAPCEAACARSDHDAPVAIRALKRFVAEGGPEAPPRPVPDRIQRVAVIGSGPAGVTAAYDLRLLGFHVTVFEAEDEAGGMLRHGIADYRLPPAVLDAELEVLWQTGIELRTGCRIATYDQLEELLRDGYNAVLLAVGAQRGRHLGVPGEDDLAGVEDALAFLRRVNDGDHTPVIGRVVVIGGGSTAVEAARTALRLGASSVEVVYRRSRQEMPAGAEEVKGAAAEGIEFRFLQSPIRAVGHDGRVTGVECLEVGLGEPDAGGRPKPVPIPGTEHVIPADLALAAVGQEVELGMIPGSLAAEMIAGDRLRADPNSLMTRMWGVFGAGDAVTGPATVIEAIAAGHRAAESIQSYLERGFPGPSTPEPPAGVEYELPDPIPARVDRIEPGSAPLRTGDEFAEVEQQYDTAAAVAEAARCLRCGPCGECVLCAPGCDRRHLLVDDAHAPWELRVPSAAASGVMGLPAATLPLQVELHARRCRGCGLCLDVCQFDAFSLADPAGADSPVVLEAARCRGCGLCVAVCPTAALDVVGLSRAWWQRRLDEIFADPGPAGRVTLTCAGGAHADDAAGDVVRFRCVGQVDAGMLLELWRRGAEMVTVAGCGDGGCRFGAGAVLAGRQVATARTMLRMLGADADRITIESGVREPVPVGRSGG